MTTTTQYGPYGTTVTQSAAPMSRAIVCAQCRASFTTAVAGPVVSCPYCFFVCATSSSFSLIFALVYFTFSFSLAISLVRP